MIRTDINNYKELINHLDALGFDFDSHVYSSNEDVYSNGSIEVYIYPEMNTVQLISHQAGGGILDYYGFTDVINFLNEEFKHELRKIAIKKLLEINDK